MNLKEIKLIRKKLDLTQSELAKKSGVSQSLIAKIEAEKIDPTFSKAERIFETLGELTKEQDISLDDIMQKKLIFISPSAHIKDVIKKMKLHNISQLPVIEDHKVIGLVSESTLLEAILNGKQDCKAEDVMKEAPPVVSKDTKSKVVSELLKFFPMVIISDRGKIVGLVTKSDIIQKMIK